MSIATQITALMDEAKEKEANHKEVLRKLALSNAAKAQLEVELRNVQTQVSRSVAIHDTALSTVQGVSST